jgi:hypothetical protein
MSVTRGERRKEKRTHVGQSIPLGAAEPPQDMLDNLSQPRLIRSSHLRLPQHLGHPDPLDIEVDLGVVFQALGIVSVERVVGRQSPYESVKELMLAEGLTFGGMVDGEEWVVFEETGFDGLKVVLLFFLVVRVVGVALRKRFEGKQGI